jgi:actin-binding protein IPP
MDIILTLLASEDLRVDSEYQVFLAAMNWLEHDVGSRRRFVFDVLKNVRLPLVPSKRLDAFQAQCRDLSLQVALNSVTKDMTLRKGSLVNTHAIPRSAAKKFVYVIGGSHRELGSAWTKEEYTYDTVERYDIFAKQWRQVQ